MQARGYQGVSATVRTSAEWIKLPPPLAKLIVDIRFHLLVHLHTHPLTHPFLPSSGSGSLALGVLEHTEAKFLPPDYENSKSVRVRLRSTP